MGRTWTQAPSNLPPHLPVRHGNLALQPGFRRPLFPYCAPYGALQPRCSRTPFPGATVVLATPPEPLWRGPFRVIWALRPKRPLPTSTSVPGARAPPLALIAGGIYAPTSATLLPWCRLGFTTPARHPHNRYSCTTSPDLLLPARIAPCTYSPP